MATKLEFDWELWDRDNDVPLNRPGTDYGFGIVNLSLQPGHGETRREDDRDASIGPAIDGAVSLLAGSLEWLREFGMSAEEVQSRVRAFMQKNRGSNSQQFDKGARRIFGIEQRVTEEITAEKIRALT